MQYMYVQGKDGRPANLSESCAGHLDRQTKMILI